MDKIIIHTQNNCRFSSKTIIKRVKKNFINKSVVKLVQRQLLSSGTFHSHSNANSSIVKLVQKNCQTQEFTMLNTLKFIMVKPGTIPRLNTNSPCSKCPHTIISCVKFYFARLIECLHIHICRRTCGLKLLLSFLVAKKWL